MQAIISIILILIGLAIPIFLIKYTSKFEPLFFLFLPLLLFSVSLILGTYKIPWLSSHEVVLGIAFYMCLIEITLSSLYFIYFACKRGIQFTLSANPWDVFGKRSSLFIRISLIPIFLMFPSLIFSCLYGFWNIISGNSLYIDAGDAFYYGLTVVFAIPNPEYFRIFNRLLTVILF